MGPAILIVDDEAPARARLRMLLADIEADCPNHVVGEEASAEAALQAIAERRPDIVLLDVQMPGMNGMELAARLPAGAPALIFITAFEGFALQAFEVRAVDYLLKPVRAARLAEAIRRVSERNAPVVPEGVRKFFSVPERERVVRVAVEDVIFLKAEQKYLTVRTATQAYLIEESLLAVEQELGALFVRVHRNALVARSAIAGVEKGVAEEGGEGWQVILRGTDERLPISRRQWPIIKAMVRDGS